MLKTGCCAGLWARNDPGAFGVALPFERREDERPQGDATKALIKGLTHTPLSLGN